MSSRSRKNVTADSEVGVISTIRGSGNRDR